MPSVRPPETRIPGEQSRSELRGAGTSPSTSSVADRGRDGRRDYLYATAAATAARRAHRHGRLRAVRAAAGRGRARAGAFSAARARGGVLVDPFSTRRGSVVRGMSVRAVVRAVCRQHRRTLPTRRRRRRARGRRHSFRRPRALVTRARCRRRCHRRRCPRSDRSSRPASRRPLR